jgi:hypothetical protein
VSLLVIVEGDSDAGFVKGIAERVRVAVKIRKVRGNRPEKVNRLVKAHHAEKVVVLKDEHRKPEIVERIERELRGLAKVIRVKCSLESWILIGLGTERSETCDDPEERLREFLARREHVTESKGVLIKSEEFYRKLAEKVDINSLDKYSAAFREFLKALTSR